MPAKKDVKKDNTPSKTTKKNAAEIKQENNSKFASTIIFMIAILLLFVIFIPGSKLWFALHNFLRGLFGIAVFVLPVLLGYTSIVISKDKSNDTIVRRLLSSLGIMLLLCGFIQIFFNNIDNSISFGSKLKQLYENGGDLKGGGWLSWFVAITLTGLLGDVCAIIFVVLALLAFAMLFFNIGPVELLNFLFVKPIKGIGYFFGGLFSRDDDDEDEYEEEEEIVPEKPKRKKLFATQPDFEDVDEKTENVEEITPENFEIDLGKMSDTSKAKSKKPLLDPTTEELIRAAAESNANAPKKVKPALYERLEPEEQLEYIKPSLSFLTEGVNNSNTAEVTAEMKEKSELLVNTMISFGVETRIVGIYRGPAVTRYEVQPAAGVKVARIKSLADDIALNLAARGVRIEAPIPGKPAVGIEIPNAVKDIVSLREILETEEFQTSKSNLTFAVGKDIAGKAVLGDIAKMPHLIIAGSTGSGKSVCTNSIIMSILYHATPEDVRLILVDPKIVEFKIYDGIPHLLIPVVTDPARAAGALNWAVNEMERRYQLFADNNVRDLFEYNAKIRNKEVEGSKMPQIIVAVDEFADLMMTASKEVEESVCRLAQKARAAGMHIIIATQRPTTNVITGLIKANIPSRIALSVMSQIDSRTILDSMGAEKLLGYGDMLYLPNGTREPVRIQGCFCSTKEIEQVVNFVKAQGEAHYSEELLAEIERSMPSGGKGEKAAAEDASLDSDDVLVMKAIKIALDNNSQLSTSMLQRRLKLGYNRAARIVELMEEQRIISPPDGVKPRKLLLTYQQYSEMKNNKSS